MYSTVNGAVKAIIGNKLDLVSKNKSACKCEDQVAHFCSNETAHTRPYNRSLCTDQFCLSIIVQEGYCSADAVTVSNIPA